MFANAIRRLRLLLVSLTCIAMVSACSIFSNNTAAILWTDMPEMAAYVELYNSESEEGHIEVVYRDEPWRHLENTGDLPDIVVGHRLDSVLSIRHFVPLDNLVRKELLSLDRFYGELLEMGLRDEKLLLLPISFSLPIVIFRSEFASSLENDYIITVEEMRRLSGEYNIVDGRPTRMGYSPRWQPDFLYSLSNLLGSSFQESDERLPVWNDAKIDEALNIARDWVGETNGGFELEELFRSKYMYDPMYKLLNSGRILFSYMEVGALQSLPTEVKQNVDFRWLSNGKTLKACDDVLFLGRTRSGSSTIRKTVDSFISWFFNPQTQIELLETAKFERMRSFGVAGGLSSLVSINMDALPRYFEFLLGHMPDAEMIEFPERLPEGWKGLKEDVIIPWMVEKVETDEVETLSQRVHQWRLRQPDLYR